ncbi:MAG: polyprenyl synthetase family protein [Clostridia bacterium]|nr:polyprenyl synthetase family protein [Clostridia bacterium]
MKIEELIRINSEIIEKEFARWLDINGYGLEEPMKYSLLSQGKRLRPFIVLEVYKLFSGAEASVERAMPFACALEMIHTYSLIHDDLPCMDNDDYRRGRLTNHKVYGEANALLAGDALLTYAFSLIASNTLVSDKCIRLAVNTLSDCSGFAGMAGGQMIDINARVNSFDELKKMHELKTGALIKCAVLLGYFASCDTPNDDVIADLTKFATNIGLAFQIRDDILDKIADESTLGKPVGSDEKNNKMTSLSYMSIEKAQKAVDDYTNEAVDIIEKYSNGKENSLSALAKYLVNREK